MAARYEGKCKFFNHERGFGFFERVDGAGSVFVHISALPEDVELQEGTHASFEIVEDRRGRGTQAVNVIVV